MTAKHTPGPWLYEDTTRTIRSVPANYWLATMDSWDGAVDHKANAAHIVRCVNHHDELVEALRKTTAELEGLHIFHMEEDETVEAALVLARAILAKINQ